MMLPTLPAQYAWLEAYVADGHPRMVVEALKLYGVHEGLGESDNPEILSWAAELGIAEYRHDAVPWCGLLCAIAAKRAGKSWPAKPLWALNWLQFGTRQDTAMFGDVLVFVRPGGGHVGLCIGEDAAAFHVLGGNTSDAVSIARIPRARLRGIRRPRYAAVPTQVRPVELAATGALSSNES